MPSTGAEKHLRPSVVNGWANAKPYLKSTGRAWTDCIRPAAATMSLTGPALQAPGCSRGANRGPWPDSISDESRRPVDDLPGQAAFETILAMVDGPATMHLTPVWEWIGKSPCLSTAIWFSPHTDMKTPHWWPREFPSGGHGFTQRDQVSGVTPFPAVACWSRTLSPPVSHRWAWWSSRSTVAVARVLGMISSKPAGCRLDDTATERFS